MSDTTPTTSHAASRPRGSRPVRVLSILRGSDAGSARTADPVLDVNAYAVADEVELTLVLKDRGVELAEAGGRSHPVHIAGLPVPSAHPADDLRGLVDSGVRVVVVREDLDQRGLGAASIVDGLEVVDEAALAAMVVEHDVVLTATA